MPKKLFLKFHEITPFCMPGHILLLCSGARKLIIQYKLINCSRFLTKTTSSTPIVETIKLINTYQSLSKFVSLAFLFVTEGIIVIVISPISRLGIVTRIF